VPQLPSLIGFLLIQFILKFGIPLSQEAVEFGLVLEVVEIEWFPRGKDDYLL
jgi:hypothetical protein